MVTETLYRDYEKKRDNQRELFALVATLIPARRVLYPGSYLDLAPSFVFPAVTYVDTDRRATAFFNDKALLDRLIRENLSDTTGTEITFHHADYTTDFGGKAESFDLLVSLFAGYVSRSCARYVRSGGWLLANDSHGDAGVIAFDPEFQLFATIHLSDGHYQLDTNALDTYFIPKRRTAVTQKLLLATNKGVRYSREAEVYLFQKSL